MEGGFSPFQTIKIKTRFTKEYNVDRGNGALTYILAYDSDKNEKKYYLHFYRTNIKNVYLAILDPWREKLDINYWKERQYNLIYQGIVRKLFFHHRLWGFITYSEFTENIEFVPFFLVEVESKDGDVSEGDIGCLLAHALRDFFHYRDWELFLKYEPIWNYIKFSNVHYELWGGGPNMGWVLLGDMLTRKIIPVKFSYDHEDGELELKAKVYMIEEKRYEVDDDGIPHVKIAKD